MASIDVMSDTTGKMLSNSIDTESFLIAKLVMSYKSSLGLEIIQPIVRQGLAPKMFRLGDIICFNHKQYGDLECRVIGFDVDTPADSENIKHTMTLEILEIPGTVPFDSSEALYYAEEELPAGTYNFTLTAGFDTAHGGGKTYYFTITKAVPKGGHICFPWLYNTNAVDTKIVTYESPTSSTEIESVSVTQGTSGTALTSTNTSVRMRLGYNKYEESNVFQYLNATKAANTWFEPQNNFDRPNFLYKTNGFLYADDSSLARCAVDVIKYDSITNEQYTTKVFLLDTTNVNGVDASTSSKSFVYPYYSGISHEASNGAYDRRIKYEKGEEKSWWLGGFGTTGYNCCAVSSDGSIVKTKNPNLFCKLCPVFVIG